MPPRARCVQPKIMPSQASVGSKDNAVSNAINNHETRSKRTFASTQPSISTSSDSSMPATNLPPSSKRARNSSPVHAHPIQLNLVNSGGLVQQEQPTVINNGKGKDKVNNSSLRRTPSFYPGCYGTRNTVPAAYVNTRSHTHFNLAKETDPFVSDGNDSEDSETEWYNAPQVEDTAQKNLSKVSQAAAIERPSWDGLVAAAGSSVSAPSLTQGIVAAESSATTPSLTQGIAAVGSSATAPSLTQGSATSQESGSSGIDDNTSLPNTTWPADTELIAVTGTNKILLTLQSPVMRTVFHTAFEHIRGSLLFINAFPDSALAIAMASEAVALSANSHLPGSFNIHMRLQGDEEYMTKMCRLPRGRIALIRGEVKERCAGIIQVSFFSAGTPATIIQVVEKQLSNYHYTFPTSLMHNLPLRTRPYRNARIISVIQDLYFSGGTNSYASRFEDHFPIFTANDGTVKHEVPIPMVALVATALYAAIYEWHSGRHHPTDFSANSYLDVYQGHIDTFHHIRNHRALAFHSMMSDIYTQASGTDGGTAAVPIANLDIEELEV